MDSLEFTTQASAADGSAHSVALNFSNRRRKFALTVVALAFVMDLLDTTIVNIAIPSIQENLHATTTMVEWFIAGYALAFSLLLITGGRLGDTYEYKRLFQGGVGAFALASLFCGLAQNPHQLIAARVVQGMAAAMMVPQVLALTQIMYPPHKRIRVQALFGLMGGTSAALGPVLGAFLIHSNIFGLEWRPIFLINLPVAVLALIAGQFALPAGRSTHPLRPDLPGAAFLTVILFLIMFPLLEGGTLGWPWYVFVSIGTALLLVPFFVRYLNWKSARDGAPLLIPQIFRERAFSIGLIVSFIFNLGVSGYVLFFTLLVQVGLGYGVLRAGMYSAPFAVGVFLSLGLVGKRFMPLLGRRMIPVGAAMMLIGMVTLAILLPSVPPDQTFAMRIAIPQLINGIGLGTFLTAMSPIILSNVEVRHAGIAAGIMNSVQQFCVAMGIAVVGGIFFALLAHGVDRKIEAALPRLLTDSTGQFVNAGSQDSIRTRLRSCSYAELRLSADSAAEEQAACASVLKHPDETSPVDQQVLKESAIVRTTTYGWAFRWAIALEVCLLSASSLLSFALPRELKIFENPTVH
jgi:EmrB/QacA subfamily drug resistance transporter